MNTLKPKHVQIIDGFWKSRVDQLTEIIVPYQWETLNNRTEGVPLSHAVENFRIAAGESNGSPEGTIFQDSDVAKWIEAAAYSLQARPDPELEDNIDELVRLIGKSQHDNGYVNTFFTAKGIEQRWSDLIQGHELYCAGHLIEAAVAYFDATGKREFLDIMCRYVDLIDREFGPQEGKNHSYDGHPEVELALYRLGEATGVDRYRDLADHFVNIRGSVEKFYKGVPAKEGMIPKTRWFKSDYYLAHQSVRDMTEVTGHAVRAVYLYTAMADQYLRTQEPELGKALHALWQNLESRRVYITGGIGSQSHGERFTVDYDLPSERGYTESCASIGLIFWAWRMTLATGDSRFADMAERALYNGAISGISQDGKAYFYVNPLEVKPDIAVYRQDMEHVETHRLGWFDCACCPTNIARLIGSVGQYAYSWKERDLYVHQYISSKTSLSAEQGDIGLDVRTRYPWNGTIRLELSMDSEQEFALHLRIPDWCDAYSVTTSGREISSSKLRNGYLVVDRLWTSGDSVELNLDIKPRLVRAQTKAHGQAGKTAVAYGPLVYCVEEFDNGADLQELIIDSRAKVSVETTTSGNQEVVKLQLSGYREQSSDASLYSNTNPVRKPVAVNAIPYFQWGNRDRDGEMRVWIRVE